MVAFRSHLTVLQTSASVYSSATAFRVPEVDGETGKLVQWRSISYRQFQDDVDLFARYWARTLRADGVPREAVVGLW